MKSNSTSVTTIRRTYEFTHEEILKALQSSGKISVIADAQQIEAEVYFQVPGGGDYSNTKIQISDQDPIHVKIITKTESTAR